MPLIGTEEGRFIEASGGEYQGFVDEADGRRRFEDILISRHAFYDEVRRNVIETFIATEAVNDEGGNELVGPGDVCGFTIMIVRRSRSGDTIDTPQIIPLSTDDSADALADITRLR